MLRFVRVLRLLRLFKGLWYLVEGTLEDRVSALRFVRFVETWQVLDGSGCTSLWFTFL